MFADFVRIEFDCYSGLLTAEAPAPYIQEGHVSPTFESGGGTGGTGLEELQTPSGKLTI